MIDVSIDPQGLVRRDGRDGRCGHRSIDLSIIRCGTGAFRGRDCRLLREMIDISIEQQG